MTEERAIRTISLTHARTHALTHSHTHTHTHTCESQVKRMVSPTGPRRCAPPHTNTHFSRATLPSRSGMKIKGRRGHERFRDSGMLREVVWPVRRRPTRDFARKSGCSSRSRTTRRLWTATSNLSLSDSTMLRFHSHFLFRC